MSDINFLGTIPLGKIFTWSDAKITNLTTVPFPGQDSGVTELVDTLGTVATFTITGRMVGKFSTIQGYIFDIKNIADGLQLSTQRLMSPFINGNVYVADGLGVLVKTRKIGNIGVISSVVASTLVDDTASFTTWNISTLDKVKNLITGAVSTISGAPTLTTIPLTTNIFTVTGTPYAVTSYINVKVVSCNFRWELPGLSWCDYTIEFTQSA